MRLFVNNLLLGGTMILSGCESTPPDPYSNVRMLTSEEMGVTAQQEDPVAQAEKAHNAQFAKGRKTP